MRSVTLFTTAAPVPRYCFYRWFWGPCRLTLVESTCSTKLTHISAGALSFGTARCWREQSPTAVSVSHFVSVLFFTTFFFPSISTLLKCAVLRYICLVLLSYFPQFFLSNHILKASLFAVRHSTFFVKSFFSRVLFILLRNLTESYGFFFFFSRRRSLL